jgi:hypothetical protein
MAKVNGVPGFTQTDLLNVTEQLLVDGVPVATGPHAANVKIINSTSDLPDPVLGKYILEGNTVYDFSALSGISLANTFDCSAGGITIKAETALYAMLFYFGTDDVFTGPNLDIRNITIFAPSAQIFNLVKTGAADYFLSNTTLIAAAAKYGTFDLQDLNIINCGSIDLADGLTLVGTEWNTTRADGFNLQSTSASFVGIDVTGATLSDARFDSVVMNAPAGAEGFKALASNANIAPNEICTYINGAFTGGITPLAGGVTTEDIRYDFGPNGGLPDSIIAANPYLTTPTTVVINAINTFVKVNQGNWLSSIDERLSVSADGDVTNDTEQPIRIDFTGFITMEKVGGGADYIIARYALNDDPSDPASIITENGTENSQPTSVPLVGIFSLNPGDSVSIWVANTDSTANIIVVNAKFTNFRLR